MTVAALNPPEDLPRGPEILRALVCPFNEPIQPPHKDAGHRFRWQDVRLPVNPEAVALNTDHDTSTIGVVIAATKRHDGLWASLKVGLTAERLIRAGYVGVSPEIDNGELVGVALTVKRPGRVAFSENRRLSAELSPSGGTGGARVGAVVSPHRPGKWEGSRDHVPLQRTGAGARGG
jgi:hypothetical protein